MKLRLLWILPLAAAVFITLQMTAISRASDSDESMQSVYDRVIKSGTIRCGYSLRYPFLIKDPNTGTLSGVSYDYVNELGKKLSLKIEWAQEAGNGEMVQDLKQGKYDAMCTALWPTSARAREMDFVAPIARMPVSAFVRANDHRFDQGYDVMDKPDVRFGTIDGNAPTKIVNEMFTHAQKVSLPELTNPNEILQLLISNKADIQVGDSTMPDDFNKKNGNQIRRVNLPPLAEFPLSIGVPADNYRFQRMLSIATGEIINNGGMQRIFEKYGMKDKLTPIMQANP